MTTVQQINRLDPNLAPFADAVLAAFKVYDIGTRVRQEMFLAQYAHETGGFKHFVENLNYSKEALLALFGKYFKTEADAAAYARQPQKIANRIYANRMGNGAEISGDGWLFRGRGFPQLTGHDNYVAYSKAAHGDDTCVLNPDLLLAAPDAVSAGAWFWHQNGLNALADAGTEQAFEAVTRRINGGLNGLANRIAWWHKAQLALA